MNRIRADLVLLFVALIWGSSFVVQRVAARYLDTFTFNGLRFLFAGLLLIPFSDLSPFRRGDRSLAFGRKNSAGSNTPTGFNRKSVLFVSLGGGLLFGSAGLQQLGLKYTTAGNAGFISSLYVVFVPVLLVIFWRSRISWLSWVGAGIAILGSLLLSTGGSFLLAKGDILEMAGAFFAAGHVILVSRAVKHVDVITFSTGQYIAAGILNLLVSFGMRMPLGGLASSWWTVVYIGLISTAVGYTLQVYGQKYAPPTDATILLSMESVFAALTGFAFLGEPMKSVQLVGGGLIIAAVLITQSRSTRASAEAIYPDILEEKVPCVRRKANE